MTPRPLALPAVTGLCLWFALASQAATVKPGSGASNVDLTLTGRLTDKVNSETVEWRHVGPLPPAAPNNPPTYIRGVRVKADGKGSPIIAWWNAAPTTILAFYPRLNGLWPLPDAAGSLISAAVQYGGRVVDLYMFRLEGNTLKEVGDMEGEDMSVMRIGRRLVVEVIPDDYYRVPTLYAWNGHEFDEASREFPAFYAKLGPSYVRGVHNPHLLPAEALVASCKLALQAYELAGRPAAGRKACLDAKYRISSDQGLIPASATQSPQNFAQERKAAVKRINALLSK